MRGDVWLVNLDPTVGSEIRKTRPAVVVNSDAIGTLPLRLIAPITDWKERFGKNPWHVKIDNDTSNGLTKVSAVDALQLRGLDITRFVKKLGKLPPLTMEEIATAIAIVVEFQ